jgi:hypothetical protein
MTVGGSSGICASCGSRASPNTASTLALISAPSELKEVKRLIDNGELMIEANDLGAVQLASEAGLPFVCGPAINAYNADVLRMLLKQGMQRWVMPVELSRDWLMQLNQDLGRERQQFEVEVFAYGHLPLAYSARCFTARSLDRPKDNCELACIDYPTGRLASSREGQKVFNLNGIQTQSGYCYNLGNELKGMEGLVDVVRLSPEGMETLTMLDHSLEMEGRGCSSNSSCSMRTGCNFRTQIRVRPQRISLRALPLTTLSLSRALKAPHSPVGSITDNCYIFSRTSHN